MGYTTDFFNQKLRLNKQLSVDDKNFLEKLANTRRMARNIEGFGVEGEFYVDGGGMMGQDHEDNIIDHNRPPRTQPGLWCQWTPTEDGWGLEWDGGEKFYNYVEWLEYIINWLKPRGYVLNGTVDWQGEDSEDRGTIVVSNNVVAERARGNDGEEATRVFFVTDSIEANEELHETLEDAVDYAKNEMDAGSGRRIRVCIVRNAFREVDGGWNYDDQADTFEEVKTLDIDLRED